MYTFFSVLPTQHQTLLENIALNEKCHFSSCHKDLYLIHYIPTMTNLRTRSHLLIFHQLQADLDVYLCSFCPSMVKIWNTLPATVIEAKIKCRGI